MDTCPIRSFPKIWPLGGIEAQNVFKGRVEITEKVDGSQFSFGRVGKEIVLRSKGCRIYPGSEPKMFAPAVRHVLSVPELLTDGLVFYGEAVTSPRHNCLSYDHVPQGYIALFGVFQESKDGGCLGADPGQWVTHHSVLAEYAKILNIDVVPLLFDGEIEERSQLDELLKRESYLGKEIVEGLVIKNYGQQAVSARSSECFVKIVRPEFRERNSGEHVKEKNKLDDFLNQFCNEARWAKAVQHLRDDGKLTGTVKDIGPLIANIGEDLITEEEQNIKDALFKMYRREIISRSVRGFPEHYKKLILDTAADAIGKDK